MCGIIGYAGKEIAGPILLNGIKRLEYRGYDSVGMVTQNCPNFYIKKDVGTVEEVNKKLSFLDLPGKIGISHSRWATHGGVTQINSHPHISHNKKVVAVHNGIIENYEELKKELQYLGYEFKSQTDSEVIPHYIEYKLSLGKTTKEAICDFIKDAVGAFAILFMISGENALYAARRDSPLVIGIGKEEYYIASDIYAFSDRTNKAIFLDNDEFAVIDSSCYKIFNKEGREIKKKIKKFKWDQKEQYLESYKHYMIKEIMEQPEAAKRLLLSLETEQKEKIVEFVKLIKSSKKIIFIAAGTSYHSSLLGTYFLHKRNIESQAIIASEFEHLASVNGDSLVIAVSQSGETMDVIDALKYSKERKAKIASIVNVPYSTIQRMSNISINTLAGQEICVASTKSFVNQAILLLKIANKFGLNTEIESLPEKIQEVLNNVQKIKNISHELVDKKDLYIIGRGLSYPVAREIGLKIKEISYIHAEGMMGGELKHGTIALIEQGTPVISLICNNDPAMLSNTKEVEARGAKVITFETEKGNIIIPTKNEEIYSILATIAGQILTYYIALEKGLPIDKPRNLAKSVTVR